MCDILGINKSNIINLEIYKHSTVPVTKTVEKEVLLQANLWINLSDTCTFRDTVELKIAVEIHESPDNGFMNVKSPNLVSYL